MSSMKNVDSKVIVEGRENALKDSDELQVTVPLREQIDRRLFDKLEELGEGRHTVELWNQANSERADALNTQQKLLKEFDEFVSPIYSAPEEWMSTIHLPTIWVACRTLHARFLAALWGVQPPFTVKARQSANVDRAPLIQELMSYMMTTHANCYKGIEEQIDAWIWSWVTSGSGVLKQQWRRKYERFTDVVEKQVQVGSVSIVDPNDGSTIQVPQIVNKEVEEERTIEVYAGPYFMQIPVEDIVIIGGQGDVDEADEVIQQDYLSASDLWTLADTKIFNKDAVEKVILSGGDNKSSESVNSIKIDKAVNAGQSNLDKSYEKEHYQILERYACIDVDGSGIGTQIVLWVHKATATILRAAPLRRIQKQGLRPYAKIDFYKRFGQEWGVGVPELLYSLAKELDSVHNMKIDFGLLSSLPFGFYRATSSMSEERLPISPGVLLPTDNPQTDVFFPNLGSRTSFTVHEEQALQQQIDRMLSISDLSLGIIGGQGATRTATGTRALLGESNANLDVYLRRLNRGWKRALHYLFCTLQDKLPNNFQFRILGDDGSQYWETIEDVKAIAGQFDFEIDGNSANSNKSVQIEVANSIVAAVMNPLLIQMGVVTPINIFNAYKNKLVVEGVKEFSRYLTKPQGQTTVHTPEEIANSVLAGINIKLGPEQDLQGFLDYFDYIVSTDEMLGQFSEQQTVALAQKAQEAQAMLKAVQQQAAQQANMQQIQINSAMSTGAPEAQPGAQGAVPVPGTGEA